MIMDNFNKWKNDIFSLKRYENESPKFEELVNLVRSDIKKEYIDVLFLTFSDLEDYGLQEIVFTVLDETDDQVFINSFIENFDYLLDNGTEQEWPLLIIGRYLNSDNKNRISLIKRYSKKNRKLSEFLNSKYFLDEYPEIEDIN